MRAIRKILLYALLGINVLVSLLFFVSAYSPSINPHSHPFGSCMGLVFPLFLLMNIFFLVLWAIIYRKFVCLPLLAMIGCWGAIRTYFPINVFLADPPENAIKILSYNVRAFGDMKPHTKEKPNEVLEYLQDCDADIICLQEYIVGGKLRKKDVDYALRAYKYKHHLPLGKGGWNGLGVYSRYPILSAEPVKYESAHHGSVVYRIKVKEDTLVVVNNHLESNQIHVSDVETYHEIIDMTNKANLFRGSRKLLRKMAEATKVRSKQADVLVKTLRHLKGKSVVFCGDLNDTPISYAHHVLSEELQDAFVESGNGLGVSYNRDRLYFRIDHILASRNLKVHQCTVDNTVQASDHYPIWCYISTE